jgi:hypothetical protein
VGDLNKVVVLGFYKSGDRFMEVITNQRLKIISLYFTEIGFWVCR